MLVVVCTMKLVSSIQIPSLHWIELKASFFCKRFASLWTSIEWIRTEGRFGLFIWMWSDTWWNIEQWYQFLFTICYWCGSNLWLLLLFLYDQTQICVDINLSTSEEAVPTLTYNKIYTVHIRRESATAEGWMRVVRPVFWASSAT